MHAQDVAVESGIKSKQIIKSGVEKIATLLHPRKGGRGNFFVPFKLDETKT